MKKIILSVIMGFVAIGTAFAVPTPEDRKALCDKHSDKYVWVEKTQVCVPINPCASDNTDIRNTYCVSSLYVPRGDMDKAQLMLERYAEKFLNTSVASIQDLAEYGNDFLAIRTMDGGYIVFPLYHRDKLSAESAIDWGFYTYGGESGANFITGAVVPYDSDISKLFPLSMSYDDARELFEYRVYYTKDEFLCRDGADFASLIYGDILESRYQDGTCYIQSPKE